MKFLYTNTKLLLFLLVLSTIANAQQVVYKPVFVSHCEDSPFVFFFVFSRDSTTIGNKIFDGIDSVVLPKSGSYWLLYKPYRNQIFINT